MESRIPFEILGLFRWVARDSDLVISAITCLVGRGRGCGVVRFLAEDDRWNLDLEFLRQIRGAGTADRTSRQAAYCGERLRLGAMGQGRSATTRSRFRHFSARRSDR